MRFFSLTLPVCLGNTPFIYKNFFYPSFFTLAGNQLVVVKDAPFKLHLSFTATLAFSPLVIVKEESFYASSILYPSLTAVLAWSSFNSMAVERGIS
ncbi:MAG: hypothetical protein ACRC3Z_13040 [Phocaeicola sp.]